MTWIEVPSADPRAYEMYRRHYSAKKNPRPKQRQFVGPGARIVLMTPDADALFVWRKFIDKSGQEGVNCAVFRNESSARSSDLIRAAVPFAQAKWPGERLYTFVNDREVRSTNPGYCFLMAGWKKVGRTKKRRLLILELTPPAAYAPPADQSV